MWPARRSHLVLRGRRPASFYSTVTPPHIVTVRKIGVVPRPIFASCGCFETCSRAGVTRSESPDEGNRFAALFGSRHLAIDVVLPRVPAGLGLTVRFSAVGLGLTVPRPRGYRLLHRGRVDFKHPRVPVCRPPGVDHGTTWRRVRHVGEMAVTSTPVGCRACISGNCRER